MANPSLRGSTWSRVADSLVRLGLEIGESSFLSCFEPAPIGGYYAGELPRVRAALARAEGGKLARLRVKVNRNAFLIGCLKYTERKPHEHLIIGLGSRFPSTTKIESIHLSVGDEKSVGIPVMIAHMMWQHLRLHPKHELLIFHNHPLSFLNLLVDNLPLASRTDRRSLLARTSGVEYPEGTPGDSRVRFYIGENGHVKEFRLPSLVNFPDQRL